MSGSGYDKAPHIFSPEGRVFQVEYAQKAVSKGSTVLAIRCADGVVFAAENLRHTELLADTSNPLLGSVYRSFGYAYTGLYGDMLPLVDRAEEEVNRHRMTFRTCVDPATLARRVAYIMSVFTQYPGSRPFGVGVLLGHWSAEHGPALHTLDPSGDTLGHFAAVYGRGTRAAKTLLGKLELPAPQARDALVEAARIILAVHDDAKDKHYTLELGWIGEATGGVFRRVTGELYTTVVATARTALSDADRISTSADDTHADGSADADGPQPGSSDDSEPGAE